MENERNNGTTFMLPIENEADKEALFKRTSEAYPYDVEGDFNLYVNLSPDDGLTTFIGIETNGEYGTLPVYLNNLDEKKTLMQALDDSLKEDGKSLHELIEPNAEQYTKLLTEETELRFASYETIRDDFVLKNILEDMSKSTGDMVIKVEDYGLRIDLEQAGVSIGNTAFVSGGFELDSDGHAVRDNDYEEYVREASIIKDGDDVVLYPANDPIPIEISLEEASLKIKEALDNGANLVFEINTWENKDLKNEINEAETLIGWLEKFDKDKAEELSEKAYQLVREDHNSREFTPNDFRSNMDFEKIQNELEISQLWSGNKDIPNYPFIKPNRDKDNEPYIMVGLYAENEKKAEFVERINATLDTPLRQTEIEMAYLSARIDEDKNVTGYFNSVYRGAVPFELTAHEQDYVLYAANQSMETKVLDNVNSKSVDELIGHFDDADKIERLSNNAKSITDRLAESLKDQFLSENKSENVVTSEKYGIAIDFDETKRVDLEKSALVNETTFKGYLVYYEDKSDPRSLKLIDTAEASQKIEDCLDNGGSLAVMANRDNDLYEVRNNSEEFKEILHEAEKIARSLEDGLVTPNEKEMLRYKVMDLDKMPIEISLNADDIKQLVYEKDPHTYDVNEVFKEMLDVLDMEVAKDGDTYTLIDNQLDGDIRATGLEDADDIADELNTYIKEALISDIEEESDNIVSFGTLKDMAEYGKEYAAFDIVREHQLEFDIADLVVNRIDEVDVDKALPEMREIEEPDKPKKSADGRDDI
jgi:predicted Zn-dependent protease with MMP-like domain